MKKTVVILLILSLAVLLAGCKQASGGGDAPADDGGQKPTEALLSELLAYGEGELQSMMLLDVAKEVQADVSANAHLKELLLTVCYTDETPADAETAPEYLLSFGDIALTVNADGTLSYADGDGGEARVVLSGDGLDYLDTVIEGEAITLGGYDEEQEIKVYNEKNMVAEVSERAEFLSSLSSAELVKLGNAEHYELGTADYKIQIGEDVIEIYGSYVKASDGLYSAVEGDFDFLNELTFSSSSSGYLPWI